jgi:hypothetical protein
MSLRRLSLRIAGNHSESTLRSLKKKTPVKATAVESSETITTPQRSVDDGIEDYNLLLEGNKSLLDEHNELCYRSEYLESEFAKVALAL